jgi:hypothetical protein
MTVKTNRAMYGAVRGAVYGAVDRDADRDVRRVVDWDVYRTLHGTALEVVYQAVGTAVDDDRPHPGLQDFLLNAKVEA